MELIFIIHTQQPMSQINVSESHNNLFTGIFSFLSSHHQTCHWWVFFFYLSPPPLPMSRMRENPNESAQRVPSSRTLGKGLCYNDRATNKQQCLFCVRMRLPHTSLLCAAAAAQLGMKGYKKRRRRRDAGRRKRWVGEMERVWWRGEKWRKSKKLLGDGLSSWWNSTLAGAVCVCVCDSRVRRRRRIKEGMRRRWRAQGIRPVYLSEHSTVEE